MTASAHCLIPFSPWFLYQTESMFEWRLQMPAHHCSQYSFERSGRVIILGKQYRKTIVFRRNNFSSFLKTDWEILELTAMFII